VVDYHLTDFVPPIELILALLSLAHHSLQLGLSCCYILEVEHMPKDSVVPSIYLGIFAHSIIKPTPVIPEPS